MGAQRGGVGGCGAFGGGEGGARLQQGAGLEHLARFARGGAGDESAAVARDRHHAVMRQRLKRRAHHGAADAEHAGDLLLGQLGAGRQAVGGHGVQQPQPHPLDRRIGARGGAGGDRLGGDG